jgi:hypothetical protein
VDAVEASLPRTELDVSHRRHGGPTAAALALLPVVTAASPAEPPFRSGDGNHRYSLTLDGVAEYSRGSRRNSNPLGQVLGESVPPCDAAGVLPRVSFGHFIVLLVGPPEANIPPLGPQLTDDQLAAQILNFWIRLLLVSAT